MVEDLGGTSIIVGPKDSKIAALKDITHLVVSKDETATVLIRRFKFVLCILQGSKMVNIKWIHQSCGHGEFLPVDKFLITDTQARFPLCQAIKDHARARENGGLLNGMSVVLCGGVMRQNGMPDKQGFALLAEVTDASLLTSSSNLKHVHPSSVIILANSVKLLAKNPAWAVEQGATVMSGAEFMETLKKGRYTLPQADEATSALNPSVATSGQSTVWVSDYL